jgi:hypothetical protein
VPSCGFAMSALNRPMEIILVVAGPPEAEPGSSSTRRSPLPSLVAHVTPSQRCADPLAAILGSHERAGITRKG